MNFPLTQKQIALLTPSSLTYSDRVVESLDRGVADRQAAKRGKGWLASLVGHIATFPRRYAVRAELETLSDRELADIGLHRAELGRVFDRDFARRRGLAN